MVNTRTEFLGLPLNAGVTIADICQLIGKREQSTLVTFINPSTWVETKKQPEYKALLNQMSYVIPNSLCVTLAAKYFSGLESPLIRFETYSLADPFFKTALDKKASLMLIGGQPAVDERVQDKLEANYKGLNFIAGMHGYGELASKVSHVMQKKPDVVIVGMGTPRNEAFLVMLRDAGYKGLAITSGTFFDEYLQADPIYPAWAGKYHLYFIFRLLKEPARLWRKYLLDYPYFMFIALKAYIEKYLPAK